MCMCVACSSLWLNMLAVLVILFLWASLGMVAFAYYFYCDPLLGKRIQRYDQVSSHLLPSPLLSTQPTRWRALQLPLPAPHVLLIHLSHVQHLYTSIYRHRSSYFMFMCCR